MASNAFGSTFLEDIQPLPLFQHKVAPFFIGQTKENRTPEIYSNYDYYNYLHKEIYGY